MVTWFVGINGVYRGRIFHYFLWATLLLSFVLAITCWVVGGIVITQNNSFTPAA
jgi:hypothetical protein